MELKITRQSVCMADDVDEHILEININENESLESFYQQIKNKKFLPKINGNDVVWVLCADEIELFVFITKMNLDMKVASIGAISEIGNERKFNFRYYSSPMDRAEHIFKLLDGSKYYIWRDGWQSEYNLYNISPEIETKWLNEIGEEH